MGKVLKGNFFGRETKVVAKELLGKFLVRKTGEREIAVMINEVEVYDGLRDKASHALRGRTERNSVMFGPPGFWYVYFTYGMHWMLNVVTREKNYPAAILIRGGFEAGWRKFQEKRGGEGWMAIRGPAKLTKFLGIDKDLNNLPANKKTGLWIEDRGIKVKNLKIKKGPRIGVGYAGPVWSKRKWRFWMNEGV